jgi:hypothetical protein
VEKDTHPTDDDGEQSRDNFYHGVISKIFWSNETGVIHSDSGKEVPFIFAFVTLLGAPRQDINFLRPGMRVGFDVGWTSKGLRASTIKIYDLYQDDIAPEHSDGPSSSSDVDVSVADHPISRYRPPEMPDNAEPPRYRQRRSRPRPQSQEQRSQEHNRLDARPQGQAQTRSSEARPRGQEQSRRGERPQEEGLNRSAEIRPRGQEQRRPEPRPQGPRREEPARSPTHQHNPSIESAQTNTTSQQPNERSGQSRRRRGGRSHR